MKTFPSLVTILWCFCSLLRADSDDHCRDVLLMTHVDEATTIHQQLAILHLIKTSEDFKKADDIGLTAIFDGGALKGNWDEFQKYQQTVEKRDQLTNNTDFWRQFETSFIPEDQVEAWSKCMGVESNARGLALGVKDEDPKQIVVYVYWHEPPTGFGGVNSKVRIFPTVTRGGRIAHSDRKKWSELRGVNVSKTVAIVYDRDPGDFELEVEAIDSHGSSIIKSLKVPALPEESTGVDTWKLPEVLTAVMQPDSGQPLIAFKTYSRLKYKPGSKVHVEMKDARFFVNYSEPNRPIWEVVKVYDGTTQALLFSKEIFKIPINPGDHPPTIEGFQGPEQVPCSFSTDISVPPDGVIEVDWVADRAEVFWGTASSFRAVTGTLSLKPIP